MRRREPIESGPTTDTRLRIAGPARTALTAFTALAALTTAGCGGEADGGGDDPIVFGDAAVDMAPMQEADPLRDYCRARGEAVCAWAFECLDGAGALTVFDLSGPTLEDCAADQLDRCYADLSDRDRRGTLNFDANGGATCVNALRAAACPETPPGAWVARWQEYVRGQCGAVARGLVATGGECEIRADCGTLEDACVDGACAPVPAAALIQTCAGGGSLGVPQPDESCRTGACVPVQTGAICSASCEGGRGCGVGGTCIKAQTLSGAERFYCAATCAREDDPVCGALSCELLSEDGDARVCEP